jgi:hypothetical protein
MEERFREGALRPDSAECTRTSSRRFWIGRVTECFDTKSMKKPRRSVYWVRRKRGNRTLICSGCGRQFTDAHVENRNEISESPDLLHFDENDGEGIQRHGLNQHERQNQHVRDHTSGAGIARHAF